MGVTTREAPAPSSVRAASAKAWALGLTATVKLALAAPGRSVAFVRAVRSGTLTASAALKTRSASAEAPPAQVTNLAAPPPAPPPSSTRALTSKRPVAWQVTLARARLSWTGAGRPRGGLGSGGGTPCPLAPGGAPGPRVKFPGRTVQSFAPAAAVVPSGSTLATSKATVSGGAPKEGSGGPATRTPTWTESPVKVGLELRPSSSGRGQRTSSESLAARGLQAGPPSAAPRRLPPGALSSAAGVFRSLTSTCPRVGKASRAASTSGAVAFQGRAAVEGVSLPKRRKRRVKVPPEAEHRSNCFSCTWP
mmetsp:Transcript_47570/g.107882  ORF Transcript_47570/g.107882 Transcript_47570/m.107882 type:complete len:307 (-) Transcript_47570:320-1240(-)